MSDTNSEVSPPQKPPRNPVERAVVWGAITVLLCVLAFEAKQKFAYGAALKTLQDAFKEESDNAYHKLSDVRKMMGGSPKETKLASTSKLHNTVQLDWKSLFKEYKLELQTESVGDDPLVLSFKTPNSEEPTEPVVVPSSGPVSAGPSMAAMGGMSAPGGGGPGGAGAGGAGGPGGGGQQRPRGLLGLAQRDEVVAELKLTEEQIGKLKAASEAASTAFAALREVPEEERDAARAKARTDSENAAKEAMGSDQFARLIQLYWRETGLPALEREDAATAVGLNDEQKGKLTEIFASRQKEMQGLRQAPPDEVAKKRKEWDEKIAAVLTEEQTKKWEEVLGPALPAAEKSDK